MCNVSSLNSHLFCLCRTGEGVRECAAASDSHREDTDQCSDLMVPQKTIRASSMTNIPPGVKVRSGKVYHASQPFEPKPNFSAAQQPIPLQHDAFLAFTSMPLVIPSACIRQHCICFMGCHINLQGLGLNQNGPPLSSCLHVHGCMSMMSYLAVIHLFQVDYRAHWYCESHF